MTDKKSCKDTVNDYVRDFMKRNQVSPDRLPPSPDMKPPKKEDSKDSITFGPGKLYYKLHEEDDYIYLCECGSATLSI